MSAISVVKAAICWSAGLDGHRNNDMNDMTDCRLEEKRRSYGIKREILPMAEQVRPPCSFHLHPCQDGVISDYVTAASLWDQLHTAKNQSTSRHIETGNSAGSGVTPLIACSKADTHWPLQLYWVVVSHCGMTLLVGDQGHCWRPG